MRDNGDDAMGIGDEKIILEVMGNQSDGATSLCVQYSQQLIPITT